MSGAFLLRSSTSRPACRLSPSLTGLALRPHSRLYSDTGRQDFTDKVGSAVKPDSEKSFVEQGKEKLDVSIS